MASTKGIDNIKQFGDALLEASDLVGDVMADGKVNLADIIHAPRIIGISTQVGSSFIQLPGEAFDLDDAEESELKSHFAEKLMQLKADPDPDAVETIVELVLQSAIKVAAIISSIVTARK